MRESEPFSVEVLVNVIKRETSRLKDVYRFVEICLFDALIGNHDRHGRNFAIIVSRRKKILSPFYDNPSYLGIESEALLLADHNPSGKIETKKSKEPTMSDYIKEFNRLGFDNVIKKFHQKLVNAHEKNTALISDFPFLSSNRKKALFSILEKRERELENGF